MHDPMTVAFEIRRPWPRRSGLPAAGHGERWKIRLRHDHGSWCAGDPPHPDGPFPWWKPSSYLTHMRLAGRDFYWPPVVTIWHVEPGGRDGLSVCSRRYQGSDGRWHYTRTWRWHVWHWHLQFPPLQELRRRLLTRCAWCGGPSVKGDPVNVSHSWDRPRGRWWRGEPGLYHHDCSSVAAAHSRCLCTVPVLEHDGGYGKCLACGKFRPWGQVPDEADRLLAAIPPGGRITPDIRPAIEAAWAAARAATREAGW